MNNRKAVVLVSGGLDSATTLAIARNEGYACYALSFDYGQRHIAELEAAKAVAAALQTEAHKTIEINLRQFGGSALTDENIQVPELPVEGIPVTYVPARNTVFLAYALAWSEVISARDIFIGVNAVDYSGYPDCRPEFISAFEQTAQLATRAGVEGNYLKIHTPIIDLNKHEIITLGNSLGVDYSITVSCYQADANGFACGKCDACRFRKEGFQNANLPDPTRYK